MYASLMSLDTLPHMQEVHVGTVPGRLSQNLRADQGTSKEGKRLYSASQAHDISSSPPPASQDSVRSTTSKQTTFTSVDPADEPQLTPTSVSSRQGSSSPSKSTDTNAPSRALSSYPPLPPNEGTTVEAIRPWQPHKHSIPYTLDTTTGQKRTADGAIKTSRANSTEGTTETSVRHGRTTSTASKSSQIGELSAQLKARLTYAKVKVENGWETRTFNEIETLTSQPGSPALGPPNHIAAFLSPRSRGLRYDRHGSARSSKHLLPSDRPLTAPSRHLSYDHPSGAAALTQQPLATTAAQTAMPRGSLAPPVEFGNPRRSSHGMHHIPALASSGSHSTLSASSHSSSKTPYSNTPPISSDHSALLETPNQRTMEQDAIEMLLFMQSPGNSATSSRTSQSHLRPSALPGCIPHAAYGGPPLVRPQYHATNGQNPSIEAPRMDTSKISISQRRRDVEESILKRASLNSSHGIDNALDEMRRRAVVEGTASDSSDEGEVE